MFRRSVYRTPKRRITIYDTPHALVNTTPKKNVALKGATYSNIAFIAATAFSTINCPPSGLTGVLAIYAP